MIKEEAKKTNTTIEPDVLNWAWGDKPPPLGGGLFALNLKKIHLFFHFLDSMSPLGGKFWKIKKSHAKKIKYIWGGETENFRPMGGIPPPIPPSEHYKGNPMQQTFVKYNT